VEFRCKASANLAAPQAPTSLTAQENKPPGHWRPPPYHQSTSRSLSLPSLCTPSALLPLFSSVALPRAYVPHKSNEVRVEFRCKASANLAAPKSPTPFSAKEENKPPSHWHPPPHHQSTSRSLPLAPHLLLTLFSSDALPPRLRTPQVQ